MTVRGMTGSVVLLAIGLAGCVAGGASVQTTEVEGANLAARDSFAWQAPRLVAQGVEATEEQIRHLDSSIERGVIEALSDKGYVPEAAQTADFLLTYQIVVGDRRVTTRREATPPTVSGSVGPGDPLDIIRESQGPETAMTATEGSLLIFATDRESGRILWRAVADDTVISVGQTVREAPGLVRRMMHDFPERLR